MARQKDGGNNKRPKAEKKIRDKDCMEEPRVNCPAFIIIIIVIMIIVIIIIIIITFKAQFEIFYSLLTVP